MSRDCTRAPLGLDISGVAVSPSLRVVSTDTGELSLPCEAARRERVLGVSPAAVAGAAVVSAVAAGAAVVSASVVASAVVAGAAAVVVASAAVADTSSAATAFVAKIVVPNKTEHTPIVNLRNEKR